MKVIKRIAKKPHCGHCKKTLEEITWQTGGNPLNHLCIQKAKLDQAIEQNQKKGLFKYL